MGEALVPRTSKTLLAKLADASNATEWQRAWERFVKLYGPAINVWGRKYGLPEDQLTELVGTLLLKLHRTMRFWECRRWLKAIPVPAAMELAGLLYRPTPPNPEEADGTRVETEAKRLLDRLVSSLEPGLLESLADLQPVLTEPTPQPDNEHSWQRFVNIMGPALSSMLDEQQVPSAEQPRLIEVFLHHLQRSIPTFTEANLPRFHSWLHMVVRNAVRDVWRDLRSERGMGGNEFERALASEQTGEDLVAELERREVPEEAERRAAQNVNSRDWNIYQQIIHLERPSGEVAQEWGIRLNNLYQIVGRTRKEVCRHIEALADPETNSQR